MLRLVDVVVTTTEPLRAHFSTRTSTPIHVVENYLGPHYAGPGREPHPGIVLGWAAWVDHQADWGALGLHEDVTRLLDTHPRPPRREPRSGRPQAAPGPLHADAARRSSNTSPRHSRASTSRSRRSQDPFNAGRSNIKIKEYAALGDPVARVADRAVRGPRRGAGRPARPDDRWYEELDASCATRRRAASSRKRGRRVGGNADDRPQHRPMGGGVPPCDRARRPTAQRRRLTCRAGAALPRRLA